MSDEQGETEHAKPFNEFLITRGRAHRELSDGLHDVVAAVLETGKAGSVTLTIKVEPDKKAEGILRVSDAVKVNVPQHDRGASIYFRDSTGNLTRNNPMQPELEGLRDVSAPAEPKQLKEVK